MTNGLKTEKTRAPKGRSFFDKNDIILYYNIS